MHAEVACGTCHRRESWDGVPDGEVEITVVQEGGGRRPADDPQWTRGRVALDALAGSGPVVVGVCPACGQLLVLRDGAWPSMTLRVDTPEGPLRFDEGALHGPDDQPWSVADARDFLERQYKVPFTRGLAADVGRSAMMVGLIVPVTIVWLFTMLFVASFLAAVWEGPVASISENGAVMPTRDRP